MKFTNILSVLGLMVASFFSYAQAYLEFPGPGYHPDIVNIAILCAFAVSYIFSLLGGTTTAARILSLLATFLGFAITALFSILVLLGKSSYPQVFHISGAYIEVVLFLVLMYVWAKQK